MEVQAQGQTGDCPNPQLIDEFGGNGDQETPTFDTTTNQFRVSYETTSTPDPTGDADGNMVVNVRDADDPDQGSVASISQDASGTGESFVNEPPGTYLLDILAGGLDYTIRVEQCDGGNPSTNPNPASTTPQKTQTSPPPAPKTKTPATPPKSPSPAPNTPSPSPSPRPSDGTLMSAGGPSEGAVPLMPDGECPREFSTMRDGACYSA